MNVWNRIVGEGQPSSEDRGDGLSLHGRDLIASRPRLHVVPTPDAPVSPQDAPGRSDESAVESTATSPRAQLSQDGDDDALRALLGRLKQLLESDDPNIRSNEDETDD